MTDPVIMQITPWWWPRARSRPRGNQLFVLLVLVTLSLAFVLLTTVHIRPGGTSCTTPIFLQNADPAEVAMYFTPRTQQVTYLVNRFLVEPDSRLICNSAPDLLILVPSPPGDIEVRDAVRQTWGSAVTGKWPFADLTGKVALVFLLGHRGLAGGGGTNLTALREESATHGDVLVGDFYDSYRNLTRKVLAGLNWATQRCPQAKFVLKADQDSFVNVERLLNLLKDISEVRPLSETMLGETLCTEPVVRDPTDRVTLDTGSYPFSMYPPYVRGGTYVLGGRLVPRLVNVSRYMPYLPVEDVFINGVLGRVLQVEHMHLPQVMQSVACPMTPCLFVKAGHFTSTDVDPDLMRSIWKVLQSGPSHCDGLRFVFSHACAWAVSHDLLVENWKIFNSSNNFV
nr:hypothetical protein BaRGS_022207 [Batillaria attramentaria]